VIEGQSITHQATLSGVSALAISGFGDQRCIVLLLPDGIGLEAIASFSGSCCPPAILKSPSTPRVSLPKAPGAGGHASGDCEESAA